jgi:hypothetical protein
VSPAGNEQGRATALTILTPIRRRWSPWLRLLFWLGSRLPLPKWTLLKLRLIHYARFAVVDRIPPKAPRNRRERLHSRYLFFESNFNGLWHSYIEAFSYVFPRGMRAIWGSSYGFPGPVPVGPFKSWIRRNEFVASHYYSAYPEATTRTVLAALEVKGLAESLSRQAESSDPAAFRDAYRAFLEAAQRYL